MTSEIDPTVFPDFRVVRKRDLREQFSITKREIEALQLRVGALDDLIVEGQNDPELDGPNLEAKFALAASLGVRCVPRGKFVIRIVRTALFYWYQLKTRPVYCGVKLVSNLVVDARDATFQWEQLDWMPFNTRASMFGTPIFSTTRGTYSNITWIGGTFILTTLPGHPESSGFAQPFGCVGVDDFHVEGIRIAKTGEKHGRGGFFLNCRRPRFFDIKWTGVQQGFYLGFTDDGIADGLEFVNTTECLDFDIPCEGWIVKNTRAHSVSEQIYDLGDVRNIVIDGTITDDCANVIQVYSKASNWASLDLLWRHLGTIAVTFDTTANTITFGATNPLWNAGTPIIENGSRIDLRLVGTLPTPLTIDTLYYLVNVSGTTAQLSLTDGGAAIDLGGSPTTDNECKFNSTTPIPNQNVIVRNVIATEMRRTNIALISNERQSGNFFLAGTDQCVDITFQDWYCEGGTSIQVNEGRRIKLKNITLVNPEPRIEDAFGSWAICCQQATANANVIAESTLDIEITNCKVINSSQGGFRVNGATRLVFQDNEVVGYTGSDSGGVETRVGVAIRGGLKSGSDIYIGRTLVSGGPVNGVDFWYERNNDPVNDYQLNFAGPFSLTSTASGIRHALINLSTVKSWKAIRNRILIPFNDSFSTVGDLKRAQFVWSSDIEEALIIAGTVRNRAAITGTSPDSSHVKLINYTAGTGADVEDGIVVVDGPALTAADTSRNMALTFMGDNALVPAGSTLMAEVGMHGGVGSTCPQFLLEIALFKYTTAPTT